MFSKLFSKKKKLEEPTDPYIYDNTITFNWSDDSECWVAPLIELSSDAEMCISPKEYTDIPQSSSCKLLIEAKNNINELNKQALNYLIDETSNFVLDTYKHSITIESFIPYGIEIFEHEETPQEYAFTYNPVFDEGATWRVRIKNNTPIEWGFDD